MEKMRSPSVAGQFYSGDQNGLRKQVEDCFRSSLGPGRLPKVVSGPRRITGGIAPHAGYVYSGMVAAHLYDRIASDGVPKSFIVLGPNHTGMGTGLAISSQDFMTPLGVARLDKELAAALRKDLVDEDDEAHRYEHSIEVQLPFIQYLSQDFAFVPICMGFQDIDSAVSVGNTISSAIRGRDVVIIASTDFSHYVSPSVAKKKDGMALDAIKAMNPEALYEVVRDQDISMCGYGPVIAMMTACKGGRATVLKYGNSGDVHPMREVVGYASVVIEK